MSPPDQTLDDLLDRIVAEYSDRVSSGRGEQEADLLQEVAEEHRPALQRCFRMIRAGLAGPARVAKPLGPGTVLDGYRLVREIGRGGMAVVYEAVQEELQRLVALKVLRPGLAIEAKNVDRFKREALAVARLQHPNIVQVFDVGEALGHHYISMELVTGKSLADLYEALPAKGELTAADLARAADVPSLAEGYPSYERALCGLLAPVVRAIGLTHELGLVHRDIKPSNILIHGDGRAVVADFGLAKGDGDPALSLTGEPLGTPYYMSPEQAAVIQEPVDRRSDVYSIGVTLYEGLTGRRPFKGANFYEVLEAIRSSVPPSPRAVVRGVSRSMDAVVRKAMAHRPDQRYPTALDLSTELTAVAQGQSTKAGLESGGLKNRLAGAMGEIFVAHRTQREFKSRATFLGLPLVHVNIGHRIPGEPLRRAKGWIAIGEVATGFFAFGAFAAGVIAWGGLAFGGLVWAGLGMGLVTFAGASIGVLATGGVAIGIGALGGLGIGMYVHAAKAIGMYTSTDGATNEAVLAFFQQWMPWGP